MTLSSIRIAVRDGLLQPLLVNAGLCNVICQVHRPQIADRDLAVVGVQGDLGAEIRRMDNSDVLLRRAQVARILECNPGMSGLEEHRQHPAPEILRAHGSCHEHFATVRFGFVERIPFGEGIAV